MHSTLIYNQPTAALEYAKGGLALAIDSKNEKGEMMAHYNIGTAYMTLSNIDSAKYYHQKGKALAEKLQLNIRHAFSLSALANIQALEGDFDGSIVSYQQASEIFRGKNDYFNLGVSIGDIGSIHMAKGNNKIAQIKSLEALQVLDTIDRDPYRKADILRRIGKVQFNIRNYSESIKYFQDALKVYLETDDNVYASEAYIDIGTSYGELDDYNEAIENYEKSVAITKRFGLEGTKAIAYTNLGHSYRKIKDYDRAFEYLNKSMKYQLQYGFVNNKIEVLKELASLNFDKGQPSEGIPFINQAIKIADSVQSLDQQMSTYVIRSEIYEALGSSVLALADRKTHEVLKDSIFNTKKIQQMDELQTIYETEKKEAALALQEEEIKTLNEKAKVDKLTKGLYAGGMASALALSGLLVFGFRQRMKKNRIAREKQEEIYQKEIEYKKNELASQTLHLVQKNTFIQELMENLQQLKNDPARFKVEFRRIVMLLKKENASDKDWEVFKSYFAEVHNDFDQKLKTLYQDISEKDIRLAAFLRMNLTTKEIAATLNVLPDSILKSKYRLKKKLGLDKETDLTNFLNTL